MLSILIPTYNYNVFPLVEELRDQCRECQIEYEIIIIDDCSSVIFEENLKIKKLRHASYTKLDCNIGRSKIRNMLAKKAQFNWLLFLDADVLPKEKNFIANYIKNINSEEKAVNGGLLYQKNKPEKSKLLRWVYGKKREAIDYSSRSKKPYLSFLTLNFLIHKSIFEAVRFNESIPNLRHEDTLFSYNLMQNNILIEHIDNPIYHYGLDDFQIAIKKEKESLHNLKYLIDNKLLPADYVKISKLIHTLKKLHLITFFSLFYKATQSILVKNLKSDHPSLFLFDLYRVGYLSLLEKTQTINYNT